MNTHRKNHKNHREYSKCNQPQICTFVDDSFGIIVVKKNEKLLEQIEKYTLRMNDYFNNNSLKNNIEKTNIMIVSKNKQLLEGSMTIEKFKIKNKKTIKILGTIVNNKLNWNTWINTRNNSLRNNIKRMVSILKNLATKIYKKFLRTIGNAILMSKINYHIKAYGDTSRNNIKR